MYAGPARDAPEKLARGLPGLYRFAYDKFRVDELYEVLFLAPFRFISYALWRVVDAFAIDGLVVNGVARAVGLAGRVFRLGQNGDVQRYAAVILIGAAVILWTVLGTGGK
jgi:NADH-quinone oxidoreductase subunit L